MVSSFEPINGINICKVTAEQLETARQKSGLADDTVLAKRGVIVSLAADEVAINRLSFHHQRIILTWVFQTSRT
jgi:hypothetical protein